MAAKKTRSKRKSGASGAGASLADLKSRVSKALALADQIEALFPEAVSLSTDDRMHSQGKLRMGEDKALLAVLDGIDAEPAVFSSLADKDQGHDDKVVETDLLRERLARMTQYSKVSDALGSVAALLGDTALATGDQVKPIALAAYAIAKPVAENDKTMRTAIADALSFYGRIGKAGAKSKARKKAAKS
jgi:hypothetical protein